MFLCLHILSKIFIIGSASYVIMSVTTEQSFGPFRVYFEFKGVNGIVHEFITFFRDEESEYPSLQAEAEAIAKRVGVNTYNADPESISVTDIEYRKDYEDSLSNTV